MRRASNVTESGPDATVRACATGWARLDDARAVVLVEGVSDQIAVHTTAELLGHRLDDRRVVVLPINGAQAIGAALRSIVDRTGSLEVAGLFDEGEQRFVERALVDTGLAPNPGRAELSRAGFQVCSADLEDELIRAAGDDVVERVIVEHGEARALTTFRNQPPWRDRPFAEQAHRFLRSQSKRKHMYVAALLRATGSQRCPRPLVKAVERVV